MKAVILAGGEGTRLRPLTCNHPKAMVPIVNKPLLERTLDYLKEFGVGEAVMALRHFPDPIRQYFGDGAAFGIKMSYSLEATPLGTAGAVKNAEQHIDGECFVFNGDFITDLDLGEMLRFHRENGAVVTIGLVPVENPSTYGVVDLDSQGKVKAFIEKPDWDSVTSNLINAGIYIIEPKVLKLIPPGEHFTFERDVFPALISAGSPVYGFTSRAYWIDVGTPERYLQVHHDILGGKLRRYTTHEPLSEFVSVGEGSTVSPEARLTGPLALDKRCSVEGKAQIVGPVAVGEGCRIGDGSLIESSVVWRDARIGKRVVLKNCLIGENVTIEDDTWITGGAVVGDNCVIGSGNRLDRGIKVWTDKTIDSGTIWF
ncbi:MAG: NDP-sugar synthase [Dehalococcoidia bacterium]|nr:NDP-sugar synthase [Dehalococcoidia bacterium]